MKLALTALLVSTIAHADTHITAVEHTDWVTDGSGWEYAIQTGDEHKPAVALVKVPLGGLISNHATHLTFGTVVRGNVEIDKHALAAGSTWTVTANDELKVNCQANSGAVCLVVLYMPEGFELVRPFAISPKKVKVKDIVQPVKIQKQDGNVNPYQ